MNQLSWLLPSALSLVALGGVRVQQRHIARLEASLAQPHDSADAAAAELATRVAQLERSS